MTPRFAQIHIEIKKNKKTGDGNNWNSKTLSKMATMAPYVGQFYNLAKEKGKASSGYIYLGATCPDLAAWPTLSTILAPNMYRWRHRAQQWFTAALMRTEAMLCLADGRDTAGWNWRENEQRSNSSPNTLQRGNIFTSSQGTCWYRISLILLQSFRV